MITTSKYLEFKLIWFSFCLFCQLNLHTLYAATCTWTGGTSNWNNSANWDCGVVPGASDDVIINTGAVTLDISVTVLSLSLGGGDLVLDNNLIVSSNMSQTSSQSAISGTGDLTVNGNMIWDFGTISGTGSLTLAGTFSSNGSSTITLDTRGLSLTSGER